MIQPHNMSHLEWVAWMLPFFMKIALWLVKVVTPTVEVVTT